MKSHVTFNVPFGKLDAALKGLGFTSFDTKSGTRVYQHAASGAEVYLPRQKTNQLVLPHHALSTQVTLDDFGVVPSGQFEALIQKAG